METGTLCKRGSHTYMHPRGYLVDWTAIVKLTWYLNLYSKSVHVWSYFSPGQQHVNDGIQHQHPKHPNHAEVVIKGEWGRYIVPRQSLQSKFQLTERVYPKSHTRVGEDTGCHFFSSDWRDVNSWGASNSFRSYTRKCRTLCGRAWANWYRNIMSLMSWWVMWHL